MNTYHKVFEHKHIVFCEDHYNPLGIIRSLGEANISPIVILCGKNHHLIENSKYIGELHCCNNLEEGLAYIVNTYGNEYKKPFIYHGADDISLMLDEHYLELRDKFFFMNGGGNLKKYLQKYDMNQLSRECGISVPNEELLPVGVLPTNLKYPLFTKAATSSNHGAWKDQAFICKDSDELKQAYAKIKVDNILVQEYIEKENELCIDGISINEGELIYMPYACHYYRFTNDSYGNYMYFFPFNDTELIQKINQLIKKVKYSGIFCIEFIIDKNNKHYFLEVNFRNSGWSYAFTSGGFNLPLRWAMSTLDNNIYISDFIPLNQFNVKEEISDFREFVLKRKEVSLFKWLRENRKCKCLLVYNKHDKKPFYSMLNMRLLNYIKKKGFNRR